MFPSLVDSLLTLASTATCISARTLGATEVALEPRQQPGVIATDQFLRRSFHSAAVTDKYLYIDGGQFSYINNGTPVFKYADATLSLDLSKDWTNDSVVLATTSKPDSFPHQNDGNLWYHPSAGLLYSGFVADSSFFQSDGGDEPPAPSLWSFKPNGMGSGIWKNDIPKLGKGTSRPARPLQANSPTTALVLGGRNVEGFPLPGMVKFDMHRETFSNVSSDDYGRAPHRGAMHHVPTFGAEGIFLTIGGTFERSTDMVDMSFVRVYDPVAGKWYNQTTTGNKPSSRVDACIAGIASDNETYEIFLYSGFDTRLGTQAVPYDTINILTLPAFHWISVPYNPQNPIYGHTCHSVGGSQILVVGGADANPKITTGSSAKISKSVMESPDPNKQGLSVFDMTRLKWNDHYSASLPRYTQSNPIKSFYEQQEGTANLIAPIAGLVAAKNFASTTTSPTSTSSPSSSSSSSQTAEIAGAAVGSAAALAIVIGIIVFFLKRRKRRAHQKYDISKTKSMAEMYKADVCREEEQGEGEIDERRRGTVEMHSNSCGPVELDEMSRTAVNGRNGSAGSGTGVARTTHELP